MTPTRPSVALRPASFSLAILEEMGGGAKARNEVTRGCVVVVVCAFVCA